VEFCEDPGSLLHAHRTPHPHHPPSSPPALPLPLLIQPLPRHYVGTCFKLCSFNHPMRVSHHPGQMP
jgi:hypothetical protein